MFPIKSPQAGRVLMLITALAVLVAAAPVQAVLIVNVISNEFENETIGSAPVTPSTWAVAADAGAAEVISGAGVPNAQGNLFTLLDTNTASSSGQITNLFALYDNKARLFHIQLDVWTTNESNEGIAFMQLFATTNGAAGGYERQVFNGYSIGPGVGRFNAGDGSGGSANYPFNWTTGAWMRVSVDLDLSNNEFSFAVTNRDTSALLGSGSDIPFLQDVAANAALLKRIQFNTFGGASTGYTFFDNLLLTAAIPEPSTVMLLGAGAVLIVRWRRRQRR